MGACVQRVRHQLSLRCRYFVAIVSNQGIDKRQIPKLREKLVSVLREVRGAHLFACAPNHHATCSSLFLVTFSLLWAIIGCANRCPASSSSSRAKPADSSVRFKVSIRRASLTF